MKKLYLKMRKQIEFSIRCDILKKLVDGLCAVPNGKQGSGKLNQISKNYYNNHKDCCFVQSFSFVFQNRNKTLSVDVSLQNCRHFDSWQFFMDVCMYVCAWRSINAISCACYFLIRFPNAFGYSCANDGRSSAASMPPLNMLILQSVWPNDNPTTCQRTTTVSNRVPRFY